MIADGYSKAYDPVEHKNFDRKIQGEEKMADIKVQTRSGRWDKENIMEKTITISKKASNE